MTPLREHTPTQKQALSAIAKSVADGERLFILWYGGVRAGKTDGACEGMVAHSLHRSDAMYILGGYTSRSVFSNIAPYLKKHAAANELHYKEYRGAVDPRIEIGDNLFAIYGGDKKGRDRAIQGATAAGLLLDEYELLDRDFIHQCEARISEPGALRIYTSNKTTRYTWAVKYYLNRALKGEIDALVLDADTGDNQFLDTSFIDEKVREYDDVVRGRFIDNKFSLLADPLYRAGIKDGSPVTNGNVDLVIIYHFGNDCFQIPLSDEGAVWRVNEVRYQTPPFDAAAAIPASTYLVNGAAPVLARELRNLGHNVVGYAPEFVNHSVEICQRAFADNKIALCPEAETALEYVERYSVPGMYPGAVMTALECGVRYLAYVRDWGRPRRQVT